MRTVGQRNRQTDVTAVNSIFFFFAFCPRRLKWPALQKLRHVTLTQLLSLHSAALHLSRCQFRFSNGTLQYVPLMKCLRRGYPTKSPFFRLIWKFLLSLMADQYCAQPSSSHHTSAYSQLLHTLFSYYLLIIFSSKTKFPGGPLISVSSHSLP